MDHITLSKIAINGNWSYKSANWAFLHKKEKPCTLFISHRHKKCSEKMPSLFFSNSLKILQAHFKDLVIEKQDILSCKERWDGVLALVPERIL